MMLLHLMRHGAAEPNLRGDHLRELTPQGVRDAERMIATLVAGGWSPLSLVSSPLMRALQTAELVQARLPELKILVLDEVIPAGDELLHMLGHLQLPDPLIVGHQPGLPFLASQLIEAEGLLSFPEAAVACIELSGLPQREPGWLRFLVHPGLLPASGSARA